MDKHSLQAQIDALTRLHGAAECEIGVLTRFDIPELAQLSLAAYGERPTLEAQAEATDEMRLCFEGVFGAPLEGSFLGAWVDGDLVAAIIVVVDPPVEEPSGLPQVIDLMVHPNFRRRGIATALVAECARRCQDWGASSLIVRIDEANAHLPHVYDIFQESDNYAQA